LIPQVPAAYDRLQSQCRAESSYPAGRGIPAADPQPVSAAEQFQHPSQPVPPDVRLAPSAADVQAAPTVT